jgi:hypothetical protein
MAKFLSSTDLAIAMAIHAGELRMVERPSRFGGTFIALEDAVGVIEVHLSREEADARVASLTLAAA